MRKTKVAMDAIVLAYASNSTLFSPPQTIFDDIQPARPGQLGEAAFGQFIATLRQHLIDNGVNTQILAGSMAQANIWDDISLDLFGNQA